MQGTSQPAGPAAFMSAPAWGVPGLWQVLAGRRGACKANAIRRDPTVPPALLCPALSCITSLENRGDTGQKIGVPACAPSLSPHVPATPLHIQHPMPLTKAQHPAPQQPHGRGQGPPISKAHLQHARAPPGHSRPLTSRAAAWRGRRHPGLCTSLPKRCRQPQALCTPGGGGRCRGLPQRRRAPSPAAGAAPCALVRGGWVLPWSILAPFSAEPHCQGNRQCEIGLISN